MKNALIAIVALTVASIAPATAQVPCSGNACGYVYPTKPDGSCIWFYNSSTKVVHVTTGGHGYYVYPMSSAQAVMWGGGCYGTILEYTANF